MNLILIYQVSTVALNITPAFVLTASSRKTLNVLPDLLTMARRPDGFGWHGGVKGFGVIAGKGNDGCGIFKSVLIF